MLVVTGGLGTPQRLIEQGYTSGTSAATGGVILQGLGTPQRLPTAGYQSARRHPGKGRNPSPQPPTDLTQLLLGVLAYADDPDITQAVLTDYQSTDAEALTLTEATNTSGRSAGADAYDDGVSQWGLAQYG